MARIEDRVIKCEGRESKRLMRQRALENQLLEENAQFLDDLAAQMPWDDGEPDLFMERDDD